MPTMSTSAGSVAYDSRGSGDPIVGHLPHTTSPAAVAAELISLANAAFDSDSRTSDTPHGPAAGKEQ
jgi:hypothetical protein